MDETYSHGRKEVAAARARENSEAALHRGIHNTAARPSRLLWWLSNIRSNRDIEQRATRGGGSCHRQPEHRVKSGRPGK
jgi:hypothetical protein